MPKDPAPPAVHFVFYNKTIAVIMMDYLIGRDEIQKSQVTLNERAKTLVQKTQRLIFRNNT